MSATEILLLLLASPLLIMGALALVIIVGLLLYCMFGSFVELLWLLLTGQAGGGDGGADL
mgnify:CR=1 FL=1